MNAIKRIQAAIDKLKALGCTSTPGPWMLDGDGAVWAHPVDPDGARITHLDDVCDPASLNDAALIVALHGTIDAQLAILTHGLARAEAKVLHGGKFKAVWTNERDTLALADAILGPEPH